MSKPQIIKSGRLNIYPDTRPPAPKTDSHISAPVRQALGKLSLPEKRSRVLDVADQRTPRQWK